MLPGANKRLKAKISRIKRHGENLGEWQRKSQLLKITEMIK